MKLKVIAILFILSSVTIAQKKAAEEKNDPVVATVNGTKILASELSDYYLQNLKFVSANKVITKESSLNDLINKIVGIEKAKKNNIDKDPAVIKKMEEILYHAQISKDLEDDLLKIKVSDEEVKKYYDQNPEYRTAQILYRLRAAPSADEVATGENNVMGAYNELKEKSETAFMEFANRYSQSSTAIVGGDLGYQPRTRLTPQYYDQIKGKKVGTTIKPFRTQFGWHLVKVLGVKKFEQIDMDMYKKIIYDVKRDEILENYFKDLRAKASVKINKEVLESL